MLKSCNQSLYSLMCQIDCVLGNIKNINMSNSTTASATATTVSPASASGSGSGSPSGRILNINVGVLGHVDSGKTSLSKLITTGRQHRTGQMKTLMKGDEMIRDER